MSSEVDRVAFDAASKSASGNGGELVEIAKIAASVNTLEGFLREMKARFPDMTARAPSPVETSKSDPVSTGSLPQIVSRKVAPAGR